MIELVASGGNEEDDRTGVVPPFLLQQCRIVRCLLSPKLRFGLKCGKEQSRYYDIVFNRISNECHGCLV